MNKLIEIEANATDLRVQAEEREFELLQRQLKPYLSSDFIPKQHRNMGSLIILKGLSAHLGYPLLVLSQNVSIVQGKPQMAASFMIALYNSKQNRQGIRFRTVGKPGELTFGYQAYSFDNQDREVSGSPFTLQNAQDAGYTTKGGTSWKTHRDQMLKYRAATNFVRTDAPEVLCGLREQGEIDHASPSNDSPVVKTDIREMMSDAS